MSRIFPDTQVRTSHTLSIRSGGQVIGLIQSWSPTQSRNVSPYFEVNAVTNGGVAENIPGNANGLTVQITRYDLYRSHMEQAWGPDFDIRMLTDQTNPLQVMEKWYDPNIEELDEIVENPENIKANVKKGWSNLKKQFSDLGEQLKNPRAWNSPRISRVYVYDGFWFTSLGRTISATDNRIVAANATAVYQRVYRVN